MLVLSRQRDESIVIPITEAVVIDREGERQFVQLVEPIRITIVDIRGDKVRLGIQAPAAIPVDRQEVHNAKVEGQKQRQAEQIQRLRTTI